MHPTSTVRADWGLAAGLRLEIGDLTKLATHLNEDRTSSMCFLRTHLVLLHKIFKVYFVSVHPESFYSLEMCIVICLDIIHVLVSCCDVTGAGPGAAPRSVLI